MNKYLEAYNKIIGSLNLYHYELFFKKRNDPDPFIKEKILLQELVGKAISNSLLNITVREIEKILIEETESIESGEIYEHGYPETRLIPFDFKEQCEASTTEYVVDKVCNVVKEYIEGLYSPDWSDEE